MWAKSNDNSGNCLAWKRTLNVLRRFALTRSTLGPLPTATTLSLLLSHSLSLQHLLSQAELRRRCLCVCVSVCRWGNACSVCQMSQAKQKRQKYTCVCVCVCAAEVHSSGGRSPLLLLLLHHALAITREICKQFLHLWHGNDVCSASAPASAAAAVAVVDAALETSRILHRSRIAYENHSCSEGFCNYCVHFYVFVCVRV